MRLICFPYAGVGASAFHGWGKALPSEIEVLAVQLPGRETRMSEPRSLDLLQTAEEIAQAIKPLSDMPIAFFGYSLGAIFAFEVTRALRRIGGVEPCLLLAAAMRAPELPSGVPPLGDLCDMLFLEAIDKSYGPLDPIFENPEIRAIFLPILRDDVRMIDNYKYRPERALDCPIRVYLGESDLAVSFKAAEAWCNHTRAEFGLRSFPGGHFFIRDYLAVLQGDIASQIEGYRQKSERSAERVLIKEGE